MPLPLADAGLAILVVDTRVSHALVDGGYASRRTDCETACRELGVPSLREATIDRVEALTDARIRRRARHVVTEIERVAQAVEALEGADWSTVGELFVASHVSMRDDFEISCPELDSAVEAALAAGAVGARMTGGGFGGSAVALVADRWHRRRDGRRRRRLRRAGFPPPRLPPRRALGRRRPLLSPIAGMPWPFGPGTVE